MAMDVINEIKTAEEAAKETRRFAASSAKDSIKAAQQENEALRLQMLRDKKAKCDAMIEERRQSAVAELEALAHQKTVQCEALKQRAQQNLSRAVDVCLGRMFK